MGGKQRSTSTAGGDSKTAGDTDQDREGAHLTFLEVWRIRLSIWKGVPLMFEP